MARRSSFRCCGVRIDPLPLDEAVAALERLALSGRGSTVHLCNANNLAIASRDPAYAKVLNQGTLNLPDGAPLVALARWSKSSRIRQAERPRGSDLLAATVARGTLSGLRHFLYGSDERTVTSLSRRLQQEYPGAHIVGAESPPYRPLTPEEEVETVGRIRAARPHIVWVALGTPRQDQVAAAFRDYLDVTLVAVGAAFDFVSGAKPASPRWMQRSGLEWIFRLATEPRRLWKRYLVGNAVFAACAARGITVLDDAGQAE